MILYGVVDFQLLVGTRRAAYAGPEGNETGTAVGNDNALWSALSINSTCGV